MSFFNFPFRISVHKVLYHTNSEIQTILKFATGVVPFGARSMKGLLLLKSLKILELENKPWKYKQSRKYLRISFYFDFFYHSFEKIFQNYFY